MSELSLTESKRLIQLEEIVERGQGAFWAVGAALLEIRDSRLYRIEYTTFSEYCRERWGFGKSHAYRLIQAAVESEMSPIGDKPENEHQARKRRQDRKKASDLTLDAATGDAQPAPEGGDQDKDAGEEEPPRVQSGEPKESPHRDTEQFIQLVHAIEIMREEELSVASKNDLEMLAMEHDETARQLREKAERL